MPSGPLKPTAEILEAIRESLRKATDSFDRGEEPGLIGYYLETAFLQTLLFLEAQNLPLARKAVEDLREQAKKNYSQSEMGQEGTYLVWASPLWEHLTALETTFGEPGVSTITKDLTEILRATQYAITDRQCFEKPPGNEADVHRRIEAVLRCVFPDAIHKPTITKPIKNFKPDTGLRSVRTLIEYKFISSVEDAKRVADEVLADTRGYASKDWDHFVYVIYETHRVKAEAEWNALLRTCEIGANTRVVVISGEPQSDDALGKRTLLPKKRAAVNSRKRFTLRRNS